MGLTLILTDDAARGERLVRNLGGGSHLVVHDLYGDAPAPSGSGLIIGDVSALTSESVRRLRGALVGSRGAGVPYLHLIHGNVGRGEIQATALGATRALPASIATAMLINAVASLNGVDHGPVAAGDPPNRACEARAAFAALFAAKAPPAKAAVAVGADMVDRAIRETNIRDWLDMVARFDDVTHRHCLTVAGLAAAFARAMGLNDADAHRLTQGALLHDIGKAQVPLAILNKPGPLTPEERREMERHPALGHAMLLGGGYDALMLAVVRSHHEYLDGSGYPRWPPRPRNPGLRAAGHDLRHLRCADRVAALQGAQERRAGLPDRRFDGSQAGCRSRPRLRSGRGCVHGAGAARLGLIAPGRPSAKPQTSSQADESRISAATSAWFSSCPVCRASIRPSTGWPASARSPTRSRIR